MIRPENILLSEKQITVYQAPGQTSWYTDPVYAQRDAARAYCTDCGEKKECVSADYCNACNRKHNHRDLVKAYNEATEWDGSYPISVNDRVFTEERELVDWFAFCDRFDPASFDLTWEVVTPRYANDTITKDDIIDIVVDQTGECASESLLDVIADYAKEFCAKLAGIKEVLYYDVEYQVKPTATQIEEIKRMLQIVHTSEGLK